MKEGRVCVCFTQKEVELITKEIILKILWESVSRSLVHMLNSHHCHQDHFAKRIKTNFSHSQRSVTFLMRR